MSNLRKIYSSVPPRRQYCGCVINTDSRTCGLITEGVTINIVKMRTDTKPVSGAFIFFLFLFVTNFRSGFSEHTSSLANAVSNLKSFSSVMFLESVFSNTFCIVKGILVTKQRNKQSQRKNKQNHRIESRGSNKIRKIVNSGRRKQIANGHSLFGRLGLTSPIYSEWLQKIELPCG